MKKAIFLFCLTFVGAAAAMAARPLEKWFVVEDATVNTSSSFMLRVDVDRTDRTYAVGQQMTVSVQVEKDCYLYLLYYGANNEVVCLFPNKFQQDNRVKSGVNLTIPPPNATYQFTASPPCGREVLQVIGTLEPVDVLKNVKLTNSTATLLSTNDLKSMVVELKNNKPQNWAEARIDITTVDQGGQTTTRTGKRLAVCVGISQYQSDRIPKLQVSHKDAERMAAALRDSCKVDEVVLLTNAQATRAAIEKAFFTDMTAKSRPGDTVLFYFSGHGGRQANTTGDDPTGFDEYLVPFDGEIGKTDSMILDKVFARWLRELDGRTVGVVLDNCHSGGCTKSLDRVTPGVKGLGGMPPGIGANSFMGKVVKRAKAVGQSGMMLLAACEATQLAWEMPTENSGSVLTHYMLKAIDDPATDANHDRHISLGELYQATKKPIEDYVKKTFSADQNPVLLDYAGDGVLVK